MTSAAAPALDSHSTPDQGTAAHEEDTRPLAEDEMACQGCGVGMPNDHDSAAVFEALAVRDWPFQTPPSRERLRVLLGRCPSCAVLHELATGVVQANPRLVATLGPAGALVQVEHTLQALAVLGQPLDTLGAVPLGTVLHHLHGPGSGLAWAGVLVPVQWVDPRTCSRAPWAHVTDEQRAALTSAAGAVLAERTALTRPPVELTPPSARDDSGTPTSGEHRLDGCALCGAATVQVPVVAVVRAGGVPAAQRAWWAPITTTAAAAGGQVRGWLCPPCNDAKQASGAGLGIEAARRALLAHLAATGQTELRDRWRGDPDRHPVPFVQAGRLRPGRPWAFLLDDD